MKKVIAITLVVLILFNTMGFYGLFVGLRYKAKRDIVQRLDRDQYSAEETITLKVPLSIPYIADDDDFQRVNGEFMHEGEFYRLVKQKLVQDTLYIVCIKDIQTKHIKRALADYVKTFTEKPLDGKSQSKTTITFIKDFVVASFSILTRSTGWDRSLPANVASLLLFDNRANSLDGPPPKA